MWSQFTLNPNQPVRFWPNTEAGPLTEKDVPARARTWAPTETQRAIFSLLSADTDLSLLLGGSGKVFDHVPDNTAFPYITMYINPWDDRGNHTTEGFQCVLQIDVWYQPGVGEAKGRGNYRVQQIQKRVDELLHKTNLEVDGWKTLIMRRTLVDILTDPDNVTKHGIQQFKLFLGEQ